MRSIIDEWIGSAFGNPRMLWLFGATLPLLSAFLWWAWRKRQSLIAQFVQSRLLAHLTVGVSRTIQKTRLILLVAAVGLLLLALARPRWGFAWEEAKQQGLDIVVAIDTSRSMLAEDLPPNRLVRAKLAALDLMRLAKTDRLGLIAFAGTAFLQCPLTLDDDAFRQSVEALDVGIIPQGGTAITEAIDTAAKVFTGEGDNHKVLVLLTDGEDHEEGAVDAAKKAADSGLRIFTVGVGTPNGELLRQRDETGALAYIKDEQGNVVKSRLNEANLTQIATLANGFYLPMSGANSMQVLFEKGLAPLPKSELSSKLIKRYHERYQWFLALAMGLLLLEMFLPERKRVRRSAQTSPATTGANLAKLATALWLVLGPLPAAASPGQAQRQYEAGQFKAAEQEYQRLLEKKPNDPRLHYNAGAASYQAGEFDEAAEHFGVALTAPDLDVQQRSYYNLGNTLYRLGDAQPDPAKKSQAWEQSIKQFEGALKLKPEDSDAKFNLQFVKKKLEEFKKQQSQSQQKNQQSKDSKPPPDSKDSQDKSQEQKQPQPKPEEKEKQGQSQEQEKKEQNDGAQPENKKAGEAGEKNEDKPDGTPAGAVANGQMSPEQVKRLLDAVKNEEKAMIFVPKEKRARQDRIFKDW